MKISRLEKCFFAAAIFLACVSLLSFLFTAPDEYQYLKEPGFWMALVFGTLNLRIWAYIFELIVRSQKPDKGLLIIDAFIVTSLKTFLLAVLGFFLWKSADSSLLSLGVGFTLYLLIGIFLTTFINRISGYTDGLS